MIKIKKSVLIIDLILVVGTLLLMALFFVSYKNEALFFSPAVEGKSANVLFSFEKTGGADFIIVDESLSFDSAEKIEVYNGAIVYLKKGLHYWKINGEVYKFEIQEDIELLFREVNGKYEVVNAGKEALKADIYTQGNLDRKIKLLGRGK